MTTTAYLSNNPDPPAFSYSSDIAEARAFLSGSRTLIDERLRQILPDEIAPARLLHRAMRWVLFAGGKRLRPALVLAAGQACGSESNSLLGTACAFELIHTYSLIHDDLPSMDDDSLRRGKAACHVEFGEAIAILAGDALQTLAFQIVAEESLLHPLTRLRVIAETAVAAGGLEGMVAGQAYDLAADSQSVSPGELELIHKCKTGAIIRAAARCGAIIGGASEDELNHLTSYAECLGAMFQITDDLLDITATSHQLGKTPGKDERARKATFPAVHGIEASHLRVRELYQEACASLARINRPANILRGIAALILERQE